MPLIPTASTGRPSGPLEEPQKKMDATCVLRDAGLVETVVEPGLSARSDQRLELGQIPTDLEFELPA
jgi:hypothetical protein